MYKFLTPILLVISPLVSFSQSWTELNSTNPPLARTLAAAVFDSRSNRMIIFGGKLTSGNVVNEVWALNLTSNVWTNITPASGQMPPARFTHNAVYDSLLNRMLIWSGQGAENYNDVWAFNLNSNTWQNLWPDGNAVGVPDKRYGTAAVFEPLSRRLITFAGFNPGQRYFDTWSFQVDSMRWNNRTNSIHPAGRCLHAATLDRLQRKMFMYGGFSDSVLHDDIWSLDLSTFVWSDLTPAFRPAGRYFVSEILTNNRNVLIFAGKTSAGTTNQMWRFSLITNSWDSVSEGELRPSPRYGHAFMYVPTQEKMLIFGGGDDFNFVGDLWEFNNIGSIGIHSINEEIPSGFLLYQNYPNPFNPVTKIRFDNPLSPLSERGNRGGFVSLKIYDILGRQVTTLVNEALKPGTYEVEWDASGYPSGVYYYRLSAGEYSETRKMVLAK